LQPQPARFDAYVEALLNGDEAGAAAILTADEVAGLRLFIGPARCTNCHSGPLLNDPYFHNIGLPDANGDPGRSAATPLVVADLFNCYGLFSDATPAQCQALKEIRVEGAGLAGAFKTPTLRNVGATGPYMHNGQLATLQAVIEHYDKAPEAVVGRSELQPLDFNTEQLRQLAAFLGTLTGPPPD
jgi:cytochrome c peroxidase